MITKDGKRALLCLALAATAVLSACTNAVTEKDGKEAPASENVIEESKTAGVTADGKPPESEPIVMIEQKADSIADVYSCPYTIVCGEDADEDTVKAAVKLRKAIEELTGIKPVITTDFEKESAGIVRKDKEILVGVTNRDESRSHYETLAARDFVIDFSTSRLAIIGGTGKATAAAVDYFIGNYFDSEFKAVRVPKGTHYAYTHVYPNVRVMGTDIGECVIDAGAAKDSEVYGEKIRRAVLDATGKSPEVEGESARDGAPRIRLAVDSSLAPCECAVYTDGNGIVLASGSKRGFETCVSMLSDILESGGPQVETIFDGEYRKTEEFTVKSITETTASAKYFVGNTDKDAVSYKSGETMTFTVGLFADGEAVSCPKFSWSISGDDGKKSSGTADGSSGEITLTASCDTAGYVHVIVKACDEKGSPLEGVDVFEGGAGADIEKIAVGEKEPSDFDAFWAKQFDALLEAEPKVLSSTPVKTAREGFEVYDVRINMGDADPVSGYVAYPAGAEKGSLKIRAAFMGYGVASSRVTCMDGYIVFAVNSHSINNGETDEYYTNLRNTEFASYGFRADENGNPETVYFKKMVLRDVQALRYLMANPLWNGTDVELTGGSQGAFQSIAVGAVMNKYVTRLDVAIPWMCDLGGINIGRMRGWRPDYTDAMGYFDTANFAKRIKCPIYIEAGLGDYICPPSGVTAMYNGITAPKKITFVQNRTHSYNPRERVTFDRADGIDD